MSMKRTLLITTLAPIRWSFVGSWDIRGREEAVLDVWCLLALVWRLHPTRLGLHINNPTNPGSG